MNIINYLVRSVLKPDISLATLCAMILCVSLFGLWGIIPAVPLVYVIQYLEQKVGWGVQLEDGDDECK